MPPGSESRLVAEWERPITNRSIKMNRYGNHDDEGVSRRLEALGYNPSTWQLPVTEEFVTDFERDYDTRLPIEYRAFLLKFGGWTGQASCNFLEMATPLGESAWIDLFYGHTVPDYEVYDIRWATDAAGGAPDFVAVASGLMNGYMVVVRCGGLDDGYVYLFDADQRSLWTDQMFREKYPALSPLIVEYLELRRSGQLPPKSEGYESLYLLGRGFNDFIDRLCPIDLDDDVTDEL